MSLVPTIFFIPSAFDSSIVYHYLIFTDGMDNNTKASHMRTVEPPNKGITFTVPCREAVLVVQVCPHSEGSSIISFMAKTKKLIQLIILLW